jgi:GNAT superfamily N-acetyltransferase
MTALADTRREQYAHYQPLFWRPTAAAPEKHHAYLGRLVASEQVITLVSEEDDRLTGFLIASLKPAPPVYDPGGLSCDIDDFAVTPAANWPTTGVKLLRAALAEAGKRGAVQAVVVTAHLDEAKRRALRACGLEIASEWWVTPRGLGTS